VTSLTVSDTGPELPAGFAAGDPPTYYDISTTAGYSGSLTICLSYTGQTPAPTSLLHYEDGAWVDVTSSIDTDNEVICGVTTSLSPFVAVHLAPPNIEVPDTISVVASGPSGRVVTYAVSATDYAGSPLTATCSPASGSTFPVGATTVSCSATDGVGVSNTATFTVVVGYALAGFFQPINDPITASNPMSVFKVGSTIAVRFSLKYSTGALISDSVGSALANRCAATLVFGPTDGAFAGAIDEAVSNAAPNSGRCFHYDTKADQFVFSIGTKGADAPSTYFIRANVESVDFFRLATHEVNVGLR
jgi:hypothetical protein